MKKLLCSFMIIIILFNFIINSVCYAEEGVLDNNPVSSIQDNPMVKQMGSSVSPSDTANDDILNEGKVSTKNNGSQKFSLENLNILPIILGYIALIIDIIPLQISLILSNITKDNNFGSGSDYFYTIERTVFNRIPLFDANYFKLNYSNSKLDSAGNESIKDNIAKWYSACRLIAIAVALISLIYVGIRMTLSVAAGDQARYKKMLIGWVEGVLLLFLLPYIMAFIAELARIFTDILYDMDIDFNNTGQITFEDYVCKKIFDSIFNSSGLELAMYSIMYWFVIFAQLKFFYLYVKRLLVVAFLIMIAPLITLTYPIDKVGDGSAQAFTSWLQEYSVNIFIQPLHALLYLIFVFTASEIAKYAPIVGLLFFLSLGSAEKIIKKIFNVKALSSLAGIDSFSKKMRGNHKK